MATMDVPDDKPKNDDIAEVTEASRKRFFMNPYRFAFWLVVMVILWIWVIFQMANDRDYLDAFDQIKNGIVLTLGLAFSSYLLALVIGLLTGILRASPPKPLRTDRSVWLDWFFGLISFLTVLPFFVIGIIFTLRQSLGVQLMIIIVLIALRVSYAMFTDVHPLRVIVEQKFIRRLWRNASNFFHHVAYEITSFYIEFMRGIPPIVFLLIAGFIIVPAIREPITQNIGIVWIPFHNNVLVPMLNALFNYDLSIAPPDVFAILPSYAIAVQPNPDQTPYLITMYNDFINGIFHAYEPIDEIIWRGRDPATAIAGLSLIYGAFLSEVFRAGIQSVPDGQVEASKSLGMTTYQTMRYIVVPQAIRNVLPPLGNNFISMIKDTSLVTILGTSEVTQEARRWSGSQFTYLETYAVLSLIYLTMTVTGSLLVQIMERRLRKFSMR